MPDEPRRPRIPDRRADLPPAGADDERTGPDQPPGARAGSDPRRPDRDAGPETSAVPEPRTTGDRRGADLARQILARAKEDARVKASGRARSARGAARGRDDAPGTSAAGSSDVPRRPRLPGIAAPGRDWVDPMRFGSSIQRLLADRGWKAEATSASVLARWDAIVGPEIASRCEPVSFRDGELVIAAESTAWATQLRLLSGQLQATLRKELGAGVVRRLVVRGPTGPTWKHGRLRAPGGRGPRDTYG